MNQMIGEPSGTYIGAARDEMCAHVDQQYLRALIVATDPKLMHLLASLLREAGFAAIDSARDPRLAARLYASTHHDLVVISLDTAGFDGFAVLEQLRLRLSEGERVPIVALTQDTTPEARYLARQLGADATLAIPSDEADLRSALRALLATMPSPSRMPRPGRDTTASGTARLLETGDVAQIEQYYRLASDVESRGDRSGGHLQRIERWVAELARALYLAPERADHLALAARLHDLGMVAVPGRVVQKPAALTPAEFALVRTHAVVGYKILSVSQTPVLRLASEISLTHHERWDGSGYPRGLEGEEIPMVGRIVAVVDAFDALTSVRPHREALSPEVALAEMSRQRGVLFDPDVVDALHAVQPHLTASEHGLPTG